MAPSVCATSAVQHDVDGLAGGDARREAAADALGEGGQALIGGRPLPAQRQRDLAGVVDVEGREVAADRGRDGRLSTWPQLAAVILQRRG
jgi:hypothetical protein